MNQNDIALIGEAWGEEEERAQKPFVGRAGQQLDKLLNAAGIDREKCFVTNVIHSRPENNDFSVFYEDKNRKTPTEALIFAHNRLRDELLERKVKVAVTLGNEALYALTGKRGIESWRGSILAAPMPDGTVLKVVPTLHPAALLRVGAENLWYTPAAVKDLKRAEAEIELPFPVMPTIEICLNPNDFLSYIASCEGELVGVDIEVIYKYRGEELASIAFSNRTGHALVIPFLREVPEETPPTRKGGKPKVTWHSVNTMDWDVMNEMYALIRQFFHDERIKKVGQNFQFDINTLRRLKIIEGCEGFYLDTLVAHSNCVEPEFPHDLGFLCSWYTRYPFYKHMIHLKNEEFWKYNGYDAAVTREIVQPIERDMERNGMRGFYFDKLLPTFPCVSEMNYAGIRIDKDYQVQLQKQLLDEINETKVKLDEVTGGLIANHRSPPQVAKYLYEVKGYEPVRKRTGAVTTDEIALKRLIKKTNDPAIELILKLRENEKLISSYAKMKTDEKGIVRTTYLYAKTGRFRSGKDQE